MTRHRETLLSAAFALWGLAIAIALISVWNRPAPPGQLPGLGTAFNYDAHGPFRWVAGLMLLPVLVPLVLRPVTRLLADGQAWARHAAMAAPLFALWLTTMRQSVGWSVIPCAIAVLACVLLRRRELHFTRRDAVLVPTFLVAFATLLDVAPAMYVDGAVYLAALLIFALRVAVAFIPSPLPPGLAFLAAPLGVVLQTGFFGREERYLGWHALAILVLTPFVLRVVLRDARRAVAILTFAVYPLVLYGYSNALSVETAEGKPRVNFFEDGHSLLPATEYLRGERPYRDILPAHGLFEDGLFDYLAMQAGDVTAGMRTKTRVVVGNLVCVAMYFLALAVTGSTEAALFTVMLSFLMGAYTGTIRLVGPLVTLAFVAAAVRLRRPRLFAFAGFMTVVCGTVSLDYAAYTFLTFVVAVIRYGRTSFRYAAAGVAAGVVPLALALAAFGILDDFVHGTFVETLAVGPAYTLTFFMAPVTMAKAPAFPDVLGAFLARDSFHYLFWCAMAIFTGVTVTRRAPRWLEPVVLLGVWIVASAISYAERHHLYFGMLTAVVIVYVILRLLRRRSQLAIVAIVAAVALAAPAVHVTVAAWMRKSRGPIDAAWREVPSVPRARGALFHEKDAAVIASVQKYLDLSLKQDETFFDFTNSGILYFLFRRDCPIRQYEVAFYETEELQREVIRRLEANPKVQAALIPSTPKGRFTIDGVANADRAPLVWHYLQQNFHPDFEEGEVVFWRRN